MAKMNIKDDREMQTARERYSSYYTRRYLHDYFEELTILKGQYKREFGRQKYNFGLITR